MRKKFGKVNIEISNVCNLQCSFCPEVKRSKAFMSEELFEKVLHQVLPYTELVCLHLMGEPLAHPKLEQLLKICEEKEAKVFLVSNGVLLRESKFEWLKSPSLYQVNFSLHSFFDNYPDKDSTSYLRNIFEYTEMILRERPDLFINFRLWNLQQASGPVAQNLEMLSEICKRFSIPIPQFLDVREQKSLRIKERLYLHFDTEFVWPSLDLPLLGTSGTCKALKSHFGVLADGTVVPCCLDKEGDIPLGNLNDSDIDFILNSTRSKAMIQGFQQRKLVEDLCQRCQYIERFQI